MPISPITLQRRHAELGRIRLGQKGDRGQPQKLGAFRFTSPSERYIADLAELYGGRCQPWDNDGKAEFETFSTATSIPVLVVKGGLSQWMEYWLGGGVAHRCDGERDVEGKYCDPDTVVADSKGRKHFVHRDAKPYTRLSVMLPELEAVGVFRMESHGWNAAAEIPAVAELAQYVGSLVPANLNLVERRAIKDGKTSRFVVPILDLQIGAARLRELAEAMSSGRELPAPGEQPVAALGSSAHDPFDEYRGRLEEAATTQDLTDIWTDAVAEHLVGRAAPVTQAASEFTVAFKARAAAIKDQPGGAATEGAGSAAPSTPPAEPDADGVVDAELVDEPDADKVWADIVAEAGKHGMKTADLEQDVSTFLGGITSAEASGAELSEYLQDLGKRPTEQAS